MTIFRLILPTVILLGSFCVVQARSVNTAEAVVDPVTEVETAYQAGELSRDEKAVLLITVAVAPEDLPEKYQIPTTKTGYIGSHAATPAIIEVFRDWDYLSPETKQHITTALSRPSATYTFDSPSGFFTLHYDLSGDDAVSPTDNDSSGVSDYVERCASYLDSSLTKHRELGYRDPPVDYGGGGDNKFDVYFQDMMYYGRAVPEGAGPESWNDYYSYLVLHNTYIGFAPNDDPEGNPAGAAKATAAHELHHCIQFAYDLSEPTWFMELDATYIEDIVFDQVNDNYNYMYHLTNSPTVTLMNNGLHAYASFIWGMFLAEKYDTTLMVSAWEGARFENVYDVLSDTLAQDYGLTQDSAFVEFTYWNYITGTRDDGAHYSEAADYLEVAVSASHSFLPISVSPAAAEPEGYGAGYVHFVPDGDEGILQLTFDGSDDRSWAAFVIKSAATNVHSYEAIELTPDTFEGTISIPSFRDLDRVTLVAVNIEEFSAAGTFSYTASLTLPDKVRAEILTDSAAYAGETRLFDYKIVSLDNVSNVFEVFAWDSEGWIDSGHVDHYLDAGDSAVIQFAVSPADTTFLDSRSDLSFLVRLKTQPISYDQHTISAVIVPKRGDVNRSGKTTLSDIAFLIACVYQNGPDPEPFELGDYDCSTKITLSDITRIIDYVYIAKTDTSCDPYEK